MLDGRNAKYSPSGHRRFDSEHFCVCRMGISNAPSPRPLTAIMDERSGQGYARAAAEGSSMAKGTSRSTTRRPNASDPLRV